MGEDEFERRLQAQELLLLPHNQVVGPFGVVATGLVRLAGLGPAAPLVDGEVAVMGLLGGAGGVLSSEEIEVLVVGVLGEAPVLRFEELGVLPLDDIALGVVAAVVLYFVDEEEAQHLDPLGAQASLLIEVLPDGPADQLVLNGAGVDVAVGFAQAEVVLAAGSAEFDELVALLDPDLTDTEVAVDGAAGGLFEIVAILDDPLLAADRSSGRLDVEFDLGADGPAPVARRQQPEVGAVVGILDRSRRHLDLFHQSAFIGVDGVEPVDHLILVYMGRRVAEGTEGIHRCQGLFAPPLQAAIDALRFVDDQDGAGGPDQVDRSLAAGLLVRLVDVVDILLVDGADRHHHDLDLGAGGEVADLTELGGVVEEVVEGGARVEGAEVVFGDLE